MKFSFRTHKGQSILEAILEEGDSRKGAREEGAGTELELQDTIVTFDYEAQAVHPDLLCLLCMVIFFPFIGSSRVSACRIPPPGVRVLSATATSKKKYSSATSLTMYRLPARRLALSFGEAWILLLSGTCSRKPS